MTVQPPPTPTPDADERTLFLNALQSLMMLFGMLGLKIPPIFDSLAVQQQVVTVIIGFVGIVWSLYSHWKKNDALHTVWAQSALKTVQLERSRTP
jgi:hypothetical protein